MWRVLLLSFVLINSISNAEDILCFTDKNSDIQRIIDIIQKRLNIHSLRCVYTVIRNPGKIVNGDYFKCSTYDFLYQEGNFVTKRVFYPDISSEDKPNNLFELLIQKINRKARQGLEEKLCTNWNYYYYHNKPYVRSIDYLKDGKTIVKSESKFTQKIAGEDGDPRCLLGYFGKFMFSIYPDEDNYLPIFINMPGKYYFYEKDGFQILWHEVPEQKNTQNPYEVEVWIDSEENIVKIKEGYFVARAYPYTMVKQVLSDLSDNDEITCEYPVYIRREYDFSEFIEIDKTGTKLPLKATISFYIPELNCVENLRNKNLTEDEFIIQLATCKKELEWLYELFIHQDSMKVNESIPETELAPPTPDFIFDNKDMSMNLSSQKIKNYVDFIKHPLFLLFTTFISLLVLTIFITKKYMGWSI